MTAIGINTMGKMRMEMRILNKKRKDIQSNWCDIRIEKKGNIFNVILRCKYF